MMQARSSRTIAVIYNPVDLAGQAAVRGIIASVTEVRDTLAARGHRVSLIRIDEGIRPFVEALEALQPDVVFNLCEGYGESSAAESSVAGLVELLGIPYTGSSPKALAVALDKALSKELFVARHIPTPRFAVYRQMPPSLAPLTLPVILKLVSEDASIGITPGNVAADAESALARMQQLFDQYAAPVLVEEFIDGREFTVALFDGTPLVVEEIEICVEPRIVGFRAKWDVESSEYRGTTAVFAPAITADERDEMMRLATRVAEAIGIRDYARVDFRMDRGGHIYVLEANPNPDISAGSGYRRSLEAAHIAYPDFLDRLIELAERRAATSASRR
jgi:D-alanine-D-alanine ligase